jgi:hypothetical protein
MPQHNDYEAMHITVSNPQLTRPIVERDGSIAQHDPTREGSRFHLRRAGLTVMSRSGHTPRQTRRAQSRRWMKRSYSASRSA